jgi:hypothetical protein
MYRPRSFEPTALQRILRDGLGETKRELEAHQAWLPSFVWQALDSAAICGDVSKGFVRVHCFGCRRDQLVPFSCKGRGVCSSCVGRRMAELTEHLVSHVLPRQPLRQWVLTFPPRVRVLLARDARLTSAVRHIFLRATSTFVKKRVRDAALVKKIHTGGFSVLQRFGSALQLNPHLHVALLDGGDHASIDEPSALVFTATSTPSKDELTHLLAEVARRTLRMFKKRGISLDGEAPSDDNRPLGTDAMRVPASRSPDEKQRRSTAVFFEGFSLHASSRVSAMDEAGRRRLCRYFLRPAIAQDRLTLTDDGRVQFKMKRTFSDGRDTMTFTRTQFIRRIALLIPRPRVHEVVYHGVFAAGAALREEVVRVPTHRKTASSSAKRAEGTEPRPPLATYSWAELIRLTFQSDVLVCEHCGGRRQIIAVIKEPDVILRILAHLGLDPPARPSARGPPDSLFAP